MKQPRFSLAALIAYSGPALPLAMLTGPVFAVLPTYFTRDIGLDQASVGLALLLSRAWDALCDPAVGVYADRITSRYGRRRPLLVAGVPLIILGSWLLFTQGHSLTPLTMGLASMVLYTGWTLTKLSHDAWGAELSADYTERTRITAVREAVALCGGLMAIVLLGWGISPSGPGLSQALRWLFMMVTVLMLTAVCLAVLRTSDKAVVADQKRVSMATQWHTLLQSLALKKLAFAFVLNGLASALPTTLFLPFVEHVLGRPDLKGPLILLFFVCAVFAVPVWIWAGKRLGKHRAWQLSMLIATCSFIPAIFLKAGDVIWFVPVVVITGICLAGDLVLPPSIQADVLDEDRINSGQSRAGMLFALLGFLNKFTFALAPGIALPVLGYMAFNPKPDAVNSGPALLTLTMLYAFLPVLLKLAAIYTMQGFPLDQRRHQELQHIINLKTSV